MTYSPALIVHVGGGILGVLAGFMAMLVRKGGRLHRAAGNAFVASMLLMAASGAYLAVTRSQRLNIVAGTFTFYLVATAWQTVRRRAGETGRLELALLFAGLAVGACALAFGWQAGQRPGRHGEAAAAYFIFGSVALLAVAGDARLQLRGGVTGARRLVRHLWRMGLALFIATVSFFLGMAGDPVLRRTGLRARLFPEAVRQTNLPAIPVILVVLLTLFWVLRLKFGRPEKRQAIATG